MRKGITLLLVVVVLVFAAHSLTRAADVIKLKAVIYLPVTHPIEKGREIQAVERSLDRISASITMLEIDISDV